MDGKYPNLDKKEQLPSKTMYGIYEGILGAMKEGGIKAEEKDNTISIYIGDPTKGSYLTILQKKAEGRTEIGYKVLGEPAKELAMGMGQHFPIFEGPYNLADNLSYVEVWTRIIGNEKRCESGREYCGKISVDIEMVGKPYRNSKQDETQPQQPTKLGVRLAKRSLEELLNLVANGKVKVSAYNDGTVYVTGRDEEPIFVVDPSHNMGLQSYTISGELAKRLTEEIGRYIPLPEELKNAENVRVTWEYTRFGYRIGLKTETEPKRLTSILP